MKQAHERGGWTVSEVERFTGLSRRDIQRCCYQGKGGVGILEPQDSSWGRRSYSAEDIATLYVVHLEKRAGLSLPEVAQKIRASQTAANFDALDVLAKHGARLEEQLEELSGNVLSIAALRSVCGGNSQECIGELVEHALTEQIGKAMSEHRRAANKQQQAQAQHSACEQGNIKAPHIANNPQCVLKAGWLTVPLSCALADANTAHAGTAIRSAARKAFVSAIDRLHASNNFLTCTDAREALVSALAAPGMNLAFELWLGPGSFEYVTQAIQ